MRQYRCGTETIRDLISSKKGLRMPTPCGKISLAYRRDESFLPSIIPARLFIILFAEGGQ